MRFSAITALSMAGTALGHAHVYGVGVAGGEITDGRKTYIRSPPNNNPVKDLSSPDIACNVNGGTAAPEFLKAAAGDELTFEWYHNTRKDDIIDGSHQGPIITWIAEYTEGDGTGAIWSKIDQTGLISGKTWAVDKLIQDKGEYKLTLPASLKAGKYLIRQEIIAHHESESTYDQNPARGAQFYPSCVQVDVSGSGSAVPDQGFDFNKDYTYADPGIKFNIYGAYTSYTIPGGEVWAGASSGGGNGGSSPSAPASDDTPAATSAPAAAPTAGTPSTPTTLSSVVVKPTGGSGSSPAETEPAATAPAATKTAAQPIATKPATKPGCTKRRRRRSANL